MKACGLTQCTNQTIFSSTDFLIWKCGVDNENCKISPILHSLIKQNYLIDRKKQTRVQFRVEIFTDLTTVEDIQMNFIRGMNDGKSNILDFESWPISNALFKSSNQNNLEKFQTSLIIQTGVIVLANFLYLN